MRALLAALIGVAVLAGGTAGVAVASHVETAPSDAYLLLGHDRDGKISLIYSVITDPATHTDLMTVTDLRFANRCAPKGSHVRSTIPVKHNEFRWNRGGFDIVGHLTYERRYGLYNAHGTVRIHTAACDSGTLSFTA